MELFKPVFYDKLTKEEIETITNGCGAAGAKFDFIPDSIYGMPISEACDYHDILYHFGETEEDKRHADLSFLANLLILINRKGGFLKYLRRMRALAYYNAVTDLGSKAFWAGKEKKS